MNRRSRPLVTTTSPSRRSCSRPAPPTPPSGCRLPTHLCALLPPLPRHSDLGQQQADHELAADLLLKHVGPVFRERQILAEDALLVMPYIPAAPANIEWRLDRIQFRELVARPRDGAPGPDGLPYGAWRLAGLEFMDVLFEAYDAFMDGEDLPEGFNDCLVVFIPKGDEPGD